MEKLAGILYDARLIKAYEGLKALGASAGESAEWCEALWEEIVFSGDLMDELIFYLDNHYLSDKVRCEGYSLTDLYVWQMNRYNIIGDSGKNTDACNKDRLVLKAFRDMINMRKDPDGYIKKMTLGRGMDR